jgi:predicted metal-binding membrane protein
VRAVPLFVGSYLAVWTLVGVAVYALYRPHGSLAAGLVAIAAGLYEFSPLKQHFRRRCRGSVRSGLQFGLYCVGSSIGLMLMLVALSVMSVFWMSAIAVLVLAQKLLPEKAAIDVPLALASVGLGILIIIALVGSRTHASDVRRHRWRGPPQAVLTLPQAVLTKQGDKQ